MKKTITTLLTLTMAASLAGCGSKPADEPTKSPETVIESAVDFYTEVWENFMAYGQEFIYNNNRNVVL